MNMFKKMLVFMLCWSIYSFTYAFDWRYVTIDDDFSKHFIDIDSIEVDNFCFNVKSVYSEPKVLNTEAGQKYSMLIQSICIDDVRGYEVDYHQFLTMTKDGDFVMQSYDSTRYTDPLTEQVVHKLVKYYLQALD